MTNKKQGKSSVITRNLVNFNKILMILSGVVRQLCSEIVPLSWIIQMLSMTVR